MTRPPRAASSSRTTASCTGRRPRRSRTYRRRWEDEAAEDPHSLCDRRAGRSAPSTCAATDWRKTSPLWDRIPDGTALRERARHRSRATGASRCTSPTARGVDLVELLRRSTSPRTCFASSLRYDERVRPESRREPARDLRLGGLPAAGGRLRRSRDHERRLPAHGQELRGTARSRRSRARSSLVATFVFDVSFPNARNPASFQLPPQAAAACRAPNFMKYWTREEIDGAAPRELAWRRKRARRRSSPPATRCCRSGVGPLPVPFARRVNCRPRPVARDAFRERPGARRTTSTAPGSLPDALR